MKKLGYYTLYVVLLVLLLYLGSQLFQYLRILAGRTFHALPIMVFNGFFPIVMGLYLALPEFATKARRQGRWTIDWSKLVTVGIVSLFFASPLPQVLYFGSHAPQLVLWLIEFNQGSTIAGVIFGYIVVSVPQKIN